MSTSVSTATLPNKAKAEDTRAPACGFPYTCFFSGFQDYRAGQLTRTQVQLLEYFLFMHEHHLREGRPDFWHSYKHIAEEAWMAEDTVKKVVAEFKKLGFLSVRQTRPRDQFISTFTVHHLTIIKKSNLLFGKPGNKTKAQYLRIRQRRTALAKIYLLYRRAQKRRY